MDTLLLTFLFVWYQASQVAPANASVVEQLRVKDQALLDAIAPGNAKVWDDALASNAVYVDENGVVMSREDFLRQLIPLPSGASGNIVINSYTATLHGDVATVVHTDDETENYHGEVIKARYLTTETWQKSGNEWKLLQAHAFVMLNDPPAHPLSEKELDEYSGTYKVGDLAQTLHRDGDHLVSSRSGRPDVAWSAELRDVFFIAGQPRTRKIFQRDANGKITGFADRREGTDIGWKKVN